MTDTERERPGGDDVLVVGGTGVDTIVRVPGLAVPEGDSLFVPPVRDVAGHTGTAVALALRALHRRVRLVDFIGDDPQGALLRDRFAAAGVTVDALPAPAGTPRGVNLVDAAGRRFSFFDGRHPPDLLMPPGAVLPHAARARHVHLTRSPMNRDLLPALAGRGVPLSTDLHDWDGDDERAHPWAFHPDLVFLSTAALGGRTGDVMRAVLRRGRARQVVAMDGAHGCHVLGRDGAVRSVPAVVPPDPVVDSNGAGDAFVAAWLHTRLDGGGTDACVRAGLVAGAYACTRHGTAETHLTAAALATAVRALPAEPGAVRRPAPAGRDGWRWS
ncbi:carbohydrate kinase family protein [Streptomyces sp. RFCAC02]|uniref:carbohydrate kinase family protein n=1 Tax=Streptomyces sp. RFCAC02 TaxID=2499143 RepID=UPI001021179B|nr:carbohydrate kinase family protein [Streptomyces sp. RFCAC02]